MLHHKYRLLERQCQIQVALTADEKTREELEKMKREYKVIADWLEAGQQAARQAPSEE